MANTYFCNIDKAVGGLTKFRRINGKIPYSSGSATSVVCNFLSENYTVISVIGPGPFRLTGLGWS